MRFRVVSVLSAIVVLAPFVQSARAGAIRYAGKELHKGSVAAVQKTSDATVTAVGSVEDAGKTTGSTLKDGTSALRKDVVSAPGVAVREAKTATSKLWAAVW